jgi:hypothetical protein
MKPSTIILVILLAVTFLPPIQFPSWESSDEFEFDHLSNEGYIAYVVNSYEDKQVAPKTECECKGTGTITHGDGHKTPCPYVNPETGKCEFGKTNDAALKKNLTMPFPPLMPEEMNLIN